MTKFFTKVQSYIMTRESNDEGATMVEYGIMVAFVALVALAGATALGLSVDALFDDIAGQL